MVLNYTLGYSTIPGGAYLETEFSVSCWVKIIDKNSAHPRLFDFATDVNSYNRILLTPYGNNGFYVWFSNNGANTYLKSTTQLNVNEWTFVTVTYSNKILKYFFNETYVCGGDTGISWSGIKTNLNYFGRDIEDNSLSYSTMEIFDFKIYNKVISDEERLIDFYNGTYIVQEMFTN